LYKSGFIYLEFLRSDLFHLAKVGGAMLSKAMQNQQEGEEIF
jgi:hypothetical protein